MTNLSDQLTEWAYTFRAIGNITAAELLDRASLAIDENRKDAALASELRLHAASRAPWPEEISVAMLMRRAAAVLDDE